MNDLSDISIQMNTSLLNAVRDKFEGKNLEDQEIYQFITDNYIVRTNVSELGEAQIICLGESHGNDTHKRFNAKIIDYFNIEGSILLVEKTNKVISQTIDSSKSKSDQNKFVRTSILVEGWDTECEGQNLKNLEKFVEAEIIFEKPKVLHFVDHSKIYKMKESFENKEVSNCSRCASVISLLCSLCCSKLFIKSCKPCIRKHYARNIKKGLQQIIDNVPRRNKCMEDTAEKVLDIYHRVFIIAGSNHFCVVKQGMGVPGINYNLSNRAVKATMNYLKTKKFVILIPKSRIDPSYLDNDTGDSKEPTKINLADVDIDEKSE